MQAVERRQREEVHYGMLSSGLWLDAKLYTPTCACMLTRTYAHSHTLSWGHTDFSSSATSSSSSSTSYTSSSSSSSSSLSHSVSVTSVVQLWARRDWGRPGTGCWWLVFSTVCCVCCVYVRTQQEKLVTELTCFIGRQALADTFYLSAVSCRVLAKTPTKKGSVHTCVCLLPQFCSEQTGNHIFHWLLLCWLLAQTDEQKRKESRGELFRYQPPTAKTHVARPTFFPVTVN